MNLLLVHGFGGSPDDFAEWLPRLREFAEPHAVRLPGHGCTWDRPYTFDAFADFVLEEADRLGWDRFVLLGHSMGGMVAQLAALRVGSTRLDGLILMGTGHGPLDLDPDMVDAGKVVVRAGGMAALVEAQRGQPDTPAHERLLRERPGYAEFMDAKALAMAPEMWLSIVDEFTAQPDRLDTLRSLDVPALVIAGEQDDRFLEPCRRIAAAMSNAELVVVRDAGHSPQFEAPGEWWAAVTEYLRRHVPH